MVNVGAVDTMLVVALVLLAVAAALSAATVVAVAALSATTLATAPITESIRRRRWRDWHPPTRWLPDSDELAAVTPGACPRPEPVVLCSDEPGFGRVHLVAAAPTQSDIPTSTRSATTTLVHAKLQPGADLQLPAQEGFHILMYVLAGQGSVGTERLPVCAGQVVLTNAGALVHIRADRVGLTAGLEVLVLGELPARPPLPWPGPMAIPTGTEMPRRLHSLQAREASTPSPLRSPPEPTAPCGSPKSFAGNVAQINFDGVVIAESRSSRAASSRASPSPPTATRGTPTTRAARATISG